MPDLFILRRFFYVSGRNAFIRTYYSLKKHNILHKLILESDIYKPDGSDLTYGFYYGNNGISPKEHKKMLIETSKCDIILGTEHIAKEGLDIPTLNTLLFATPPGINVEQSVGRILRKYHEHYPPLVIDFIDKVGNYVMHGRERDKWYTSEEYTINKIKIPLDSYSCDELNKFIKEDNKEPIKDVLIKTKQMFKDCMI